ncbi:MAG: hypothetical protein V3V06_06610 [Dehalococcoidia bacterium]
MEHAPKPDVWAIRPVIYQGIRRERGECFPLAGLPSDQRLIDTHYIQRLRPGHSRYDCDRCEKTFVSGENFAIHLTGVHGLAPEQARRLSDPPPQAGS